MIATETLALSIDNKLMLAHCRSYRVLYSQIHGSAIKSNISRVAYDT